MADEKRKTAKIIPLKPEKTTKTSEQKWGRNVMELGFCMIPSLLLKAQRRLRITPAQMAVDSDPFMRFTE